MPIFTLDPNDLILDLDQSQLGTNKAFYNFTPDYSNMIPYVEFFAIKKNTALIQYLTNNNSSLSSDTFERINLLGYDSLTTSSNTFTVRYLDTDPNNPNANTEAFGIKSVDIKTNASYVPVVEITFIDVKGQSYFAKNGNSTNNANKGYGVLLDFPPPLFVLRMKGVYGLMVEYRLHLTKTDIIFNSQDGNYEIKCHFIGYNIAPLTDINMGLLSAVHYLYFPDLNTNDQTIAPRSFLETIMRGDVLYNKLDSYKNNSTDLVALTDINANLERVCDLYTFVVNLADQTIFYNTYSSPENNNISCITLVNDPVKQVVDITLDYIHLTDQVQITALSNLVTKYFNQQNTIITNPLYNDFDFQSSDLKLTQVNYQQQNTPITNIVQTTLIPIGQNVAPVNASIINYTYSYKAFYNKIKQKENGFVTKRIAILNRIQTNIGKIANDKIWKPTINNIVSSMTTDVDRFFNKMVQAGTKKKVQPQFVGIQFPEYTERRLVNNVTQTVKLYPGIVKDFQTWGEVQLVEDIVVAMSNAQKATTRLDELQSIENGDSKWIPVSPFECYVDVAQNEYFAQRTNYPQLLELIHKRYCVAKNYTYKGFIDNNEVLSFVAQSEARNLLYAINDQPTILTKINTIATDYVTKQNINTILGQIPDSPYNQSNTNIATLTLNGVNIYPKVSTIDTTAINANYQGLNIFDDTTIISSKDPDQNKIAQLIDGMKTSLLPILKGFLTNPEIDLSNQNVITFLDKEKNSDSTLKIDSNYDDTNNSEFFHLQNLNNIVMNIITQNKLTSLTFGNFFEYLKNGVYFQNLYENFNINYKFYFPALVEMPTVYLLYVGYLLINKQDATDNFTNNLVNSLTINDQNTITKFYTTSILDSNQLFLNPNFFNNYYGANATDETKLSLIGQYITNNNLMDRVYMMNSTPLTFASFNNGVSTIPKGDEAWLSNSQNFTANDLNFTTINASNQTDLSYMLAFFKEIQQRIKDIKKQKDAESNSSTSSFNDNDIKAQLYYGLKNLYERWLVIPTNTTYSTTLYEQLFGDGLASSFYYVTRTMNTGAANAILDFRDMVEDAKDYSLSLYTVMTRLFSKNNFLFWPLQSSLIFSGDMGMDKWKSSFRLNTQNIVATKSRPAFVCMYMSTYSSQLNINSDYFPDDGLSFLSTYSPVSQNNFQVTNVQTLPEDFNTTISSNTGNVCVFIVSFGKQNQSIFNNIQLNTAEFTDTFESLKITDMISKRNNDSNPISKGQNLYNVLSQRSYSVSIDIPLGNMCIQPTMYFELVGIPMFNGGYIITDVEHHINADNNKLKTKFKGTRVGKYGLEMIVDPLVNMQNILGLDTEINGNVNCVTPNGQIDPNKFAIYNSMSSLQI